MADYVARRLEHHLLKSPHRCDVAFWGGAIFYPALFHFFLRPPSIAVYVHTHDIPPQAVHGAGRAAVRQGLALHPHRLPALLQRGRRPQQRVGTWVGVFWLWLLCENTEGERLAEELTNPSLPHTHAHDQGRWRPGGRRPGVVRAAAAGGANPHARRPRRRRGAVRV